ncbi:TPA: hypothetical protein DDW35_09315 [Candidatus Sumerlaeota bacterium]|jgi:DNA-binding LacI/PurR family transcriptional regulator|nr:hypothetical protein [Candidatus Sumerlaeota bacterium]
MNFTEIKTNRVTSAMVALHAGVSQPTVSRVINNLSVNPETVARVQAAMQELGYVPRQHLSGKVSDVDQSASMSNIFSDDARSWHSSSTLVAERAGVSVSTVSRVVNNRSVDPITAAHVRQVMQELGYAPRPFASRPGPRRTELKGLRTGTIAFLARGHDLEQLSRLPIVVNVIHGIESALAERGLAMVQSALDTDGQRLPAIVAKRQVDGLIVWPNLNGVSDASIEALRPYPLVYLMSMQEDRLPGDRVKTNNRSIGALAARHLIANGHRRIVYVTSPGMVGFLRERWDAFARVAEENGVSAMQCIVGEENTDLNMTDSRLEKLDALMERGVRQLLNYKPRPTGLFITCDGLTSQVYRPLKRLGVEIGTDMEIISCNREFPILEALDPRPKSINIGAKEVGRKAVERLIWRIQNPMDNTYVTVEVEPRLS